MTKEEKSIKEMWKNYLIFAGEDLKSVDKICDSWYFGDNKDMADNLAKLVKQGIKKATTGLLYFYESEKYPLPKLGELNIVTDYNGVAQCVVKTTKVNIKPFKDVTEDFARTEGEGDKSLEYWRKAHIDFFSRELKEVGKEFNEDMLVVLEEFEVVYKDE
ncbi:ASCH domain-containing protein [Haliovirga abyssi]|uniref:RNA-binding protein n=1 Tax=Haliovirga abyssi TaxID=2996794 RepID=A0AAU9D8W8_9FUSO|nr:ASCH domain-containing protein [Haliovirga abyssi]BDU50031.1 RNA-binding protein [Haliovirga abyssi]